MSIRGADPLLRWLPFAVMGAVVLIDVAAGPEYRYLPLLALGPAFASLCGGIQRAVLVGLLAIGFCLAMAAYDHIFGHRYVYLILGSIAGVTVASALASAGRQQRERELATVRTVAEVAQRVLLRPVPRSAGPVRVAVSYTSAAAEARIGGDLYEVVTSPYGVRILVGDVQGKGLEAVETAAAVLGAFREAAYDEAHLAGVVTRLETTLNRLLSGEKFVTAILAELSHDQISLLCCGHPPPLMITSAGDVRFVELCDPSPPLGMTDLIDVAKLRPYRMCFARGDQMLFYTDGVIEARNEAGLFYPLRERAHLLMTMGAEEALEHLRADLVRHVGGPIADDAAMLLIRHR
ncbi:PP2C family protein-serine/threonine phosphatase [Actinomadura scrupuli]|uniref:PP2C family protein-serine/threonine phosphatase n=1 Tax=Actinomadura scrupuli TaxID=559629 RepID=UPI003D964C7E